MDNQHHQRGLTAISWLLMLGLIAFFTLITLRLVPLYLEYAKVASVFESLQHEANLDHLSRAEIIQLIRKRFAINDIANVNPKDTHVSKNQGHVNVSIQYERREHLVGNLDVVAMFDKQVEVFGH